MKAQIVRAMKEFSHPSVDEQSPADINHALQMTLIVAKNEYKYVAQVETEFGELPNVVCNIGELNQVFLNLIVNASQAMEDRPGPRGKLGISTRVDGTDLVVAISDTGSGIPLANRERVFDAFFTTKEVGRGTGQGLAISRSIVVDRHGGRLPDSLAELLALPGVGPYTARAVLAFAFDREVGDLDGGVGGVGRLQPENLALTEDAPDSIARAVTGDE